MADELGGHPERLAAVWALVAFGLGVDPAVVFQRHQVRELLLAGVAEIGPSFVTVLVVEQGAGVAIRASTLVANMGLGNLTDAPSAAGFGHATWVESLLLH